MMGSVGDRHIYHPTLPYAVSNIHLIVLHLLLHAISKLAVGQMYRRFSIAVAFAFKYHS